MSLAVSKDIYNAKEMIVKCELELEKKYLNDCTEVFKFSLVHCEHIFILLHSCYIYYFEYDYLK